MNPHNMNGEAGSCDRCAATHTLGELLELNKRMGWHLGDNPASYSGDAGDETA